MAWRASSVDVTSIGEVRLDTATTLELKMGSTVRINGHEDWVPLYWRERC